MFAPANISRKKYADFAQNLWSITAETDRAPNVKGLDAEHT